MTGPWCVYVLTNHAPRPQGYVGIAVDAARRLRQHNGELRGGAKATRGRGRWSLVAVWGSFSTRGEAQSAEHAVRVCRAKGTPPWDGCAAPGVVWWVQG